MLTVEDNTSGPRVQIHVAWIRPYSDASSSITDEFSEVLACSCAKQHELCVACLLNLGELDDMCRTMSCARWSTGADVSCCGH